MLLILGLCVYPEEEHLVFLFSPQKKEVSNLDLENLEWKKVDFNIPWSGRDAHWTVLFQNKIWLMGGVEGGEIDTKNPEYEKIPHKSDIWVTDNGKNWQLITEKAPWGERRSAGVVVFQNKIWLMGGWEKISGETKNDVWVTENGKDWEKVLESAPWPPREGHAIAVFNDRIYLVGGLIFSKEKPTTMFGTQMME